ncbi:MAG: Gfo/Idh/MocA family oxidoreductase [Planctomyces sp.]|nr:Gfo/Idh/MocA family oxidoreductase [Planctomyces sp.]
MEPLRMAVVGVGALGRHHARILSQMSDVQLVGVADSNETQGRAVADSCGSEWTPDYRTLLGRVDAASIVVPTGMHFAVAADFLRRSIPVLVEKPLAATVEEGRTLVRLAAEHRVPVQVGHIERFNPAFEALERQVRAPRYLRAERLSPYAFRSMDISAVFDLMIHDIELCLHLAGCGVERVEALGASLVGGLEDGVQARLVFENGCVADLSALRVCPFFRRTLLAWSDDGCAYADLHERKVWTCEPGERLRAGESPYELAQQPGADITALKAEMFGEFFQVGQPEVAEGVDALTAELTDFIGSVRTGRAPRVDGRSGLAALEVASRVEAAVRAGQRTRLRIARPDAA